MDAIQAIKSRVSIRKYKNLEVPKNVLEELVDCGRLAPSGYNNQPWVFVVITDQQIRDKIAEAVRYGKFIAEAGACIAVFCNKNARTILEDACAATENIIIAARAHNLGSCWVNSYHKEHSSFVEKILNCPKDFELMTLIAIGVPAEERKTMKKPIAEVIRWERF
ncbi:nitroreductase family protein [Treponema sp.]